MDEKLDNKTKDALIDALEKAKAYSRNLQDKRERQLWKRFNIPCSLSEVINGLSKNEMDQIRRNLDLKNLSSLNKAELAEAFVNLIPVEFKKSVHLLDQERYQLLKKIIKNSGVIKNTGISFEKIEALMGYSIAFPGIDHDQKVLFMPQELVALFSQIDGPELQKTVKRNTEWIRLTHGMLYYYGVMDALRLIDKVRQLTGAEVELIEFMSVISSASDYYGQVYYSSYGYRDHRVFDDKKIIDEHRMRPNIDYYPFTKEQLLRAGKPDYVEQTPAMDELFSFLLNHYELSNDEITEIALQLVNIINVDPMPTALLEYLQSWFEYPSFEFVQQLTAKVMELYNNTRQWDLKGHTPSELFQEEKKYLKPLPVAPFGTGKTGSNVIDIRTRNKVGRNDPCPCGSGKKYKKCCGKVE